MNLEDLPNELFVQIFAYLDSVDAMVAFSKLNGRFQSLLHTCCPSFDLASISKRTCDFIFQSHPAHQWQSLRLVNEHENSISMDYFIAKYFSARNFLSLRTLSVGKLHESSRRLFFALLPSLTSLTSLSIESFCGSEMLPFDLPNLRKLAFGSCANVEWMSRFLHVETIEYTADHRCTHNGRLVWPSSTKNIKVVYLTDINYTLLEQSLAPLSELVSLEILQSQFGTVPSNGHRWEEIIRSSFPRLKTFRFYFAFTALTPRELKQLVSSFSTPFYLEEKQWFVYCNMCAENRNRGPRHVSMLYTLPYPMEILTIYKHSFKKMISNLPLGYPSNIYQSVKTLVFENYSTSNEQFVDTKVHKLIINTQFDSISWLHTLTKLRQLHIGDFGFISTEHFRALLINAPHLSSLALRKSQLKRFTDDWTDGQICNHLSRKIRSLTLHLNTNPAECLNRHELERMLPVFQAKCVHLSLSLVTKTDTISYILLQMSALSYLNVHIESRCRLSRIVTMEWLEEQQARFNRSTCIITNEKSGTSFWL